MLPSTLRVGAYVDQRGRQPRGESALVNALVILGRRMSRENLDLVLLMSEAFSRRDLDAFLALMHDEALIEPRFAALEGDYHGHEGVRRWWSNLLDVLPDYAVEIEAVDDLGDVTLTRLRGAAHGAASATPLVETWWQLAQWSDGKCIWWRNFATEDEALAAVRLRGA
jgi:ketosteroid isomerase-like protein